MDGSDKLSNGAAKITATATLVKLGIGAGVVVLPSVFAKSGLIVGTISTIFVGLLSYASAVFIANAKKKTGLSTYEDICAKVLGPVGFWILNACTWLMIFFLTSTYVTLIKEFTQPLMKVLKQTSAYEHALFSCLSVAVIVAIIVPMLLLRKLEFLKFSNYLGVISIGCLFLLSLIATPLFAMQGTLPQLRWWPQKGVSFLDLLELMGGLISAFCFHHGICASMDLVPSDIDFNPISRNVTSIIAFVNFTLATFISIFLSDKLDNNPIYLYTFGNTGASAWIIAIASVLQAFSVLCSVPLLHFIWRELSWSIYSHARTMKTEIPNSFFFAHILLWLLSASIALLPITMDFLINFIGLFATTVFVLILPACLQMKLSGGIAHNLTFGLIKRNIESVDPEEAFEQKTPAWNWIGVIICHTMFWFGLLEFCLSFKVLVTWALRQ
jgi:amino acid permease